MYNGIGLTTVRGSATSGHISKNLSYIKPDFFRNKIDANTNTSALGGGRVGNGDVRNNRHGVLFKSNKDVIEHNKKHALEAEIYELQESMRDNGCSEETIERKVEELKNKQKNSRNYQLTVRSSGKNTDTHEISALKEEENKKLKNAFGIRDDFVSGEAFDPELQAARRQLREQQNSMRNEQRKELADRDRDEQLRRKTKDNDEDRRIENRGRTRYDSRDRRRYRDSRSRSRDNRKYNKRSPSRDRRADLNHQRRSSNSNSTSYSSTPRSRSRS